MMAYFRDMFTRANLESFAGDVLRAYWILLKIMLPAIVVVKVLDEFGATEMLAELLEPLMGSIGLASELGLVWAAAILTNIYGGMVVFYQLADGNIYTVADISVLAILLLLAHALPIEGAVAKALGVPWWLTILLRIGGGYALAFLSAQLMGLASFGEDASAILWQPAAQQDGLSFWLIAQLEMLVGILLILATLMAFMRFLKYVGFDSVLAWILQPLTRLLGVNQNASQVTIVGLMLGLSFGAGLLINESEKGSIDPHDMKVVTCFLGLCHSIIEDTILMLLLGAHWIPILVGRLIFSTLVMAVMVRTVFRRELKIS
jgi:spore maturation protein SpmB